MGACALLLLVTLSRFPPKTRSHLRGVLCVFHAVSATRRRDLGPRNSPPPPPPAWPGFDARRDEVLAFERKAELVLVAAHERLWPRYRHRHRAVHREARAVPSQRVVPFGPHAVELASARRRHVVARVEGPLRVLREREQRRRRRHERPPTPSPDVGHRRNENGPPKPSPGVVLAPGTGSPGSPSLVGGPGAGGTVPTWNRGQGGGAARVHSRERREVRHGQPAEREPC